MAQAKVGSARNQAIECARLAAAVFVVFIHSNFPGAFGETVNCAARFAVPLFFMISGYFSFGASKEKLAKRFWRILWLNIFASLLYMLHRFLTVSWTGAALAESVKAALPSLRQLVEWVVLNASPFVIHLWYLAAIGQCYLTIWVYVSFRGDRDYRPLYMLCFCLYAIEFLLSEMAPVAGIEIPVELYRNGMLLGLPMFGLGLFLKEHGDRLRSTFHLTDRRLLAVMLLGLAFSLVERFKVGLIEAPAGMVAVASALLLLAAAHPKLSGGQKFAACVSRFGFLSTAVYILHRMMIDIYDMFCRAHLELALGQAEPWLRPFAVLILTFAAALICDGLRRLKK